MARLNEFSGTVYRTGTRIAEKQFATRGEAEAFVASCQAGKVAPPRHGWPIILASASPRLLAELASGRVEEINGKFHARFDY